MSQFAAMLLSTVSAVCFSDLSAKSGAHFLEALSLLVKSTEGDPVLDHKAVNQPNL